jgi:hypothetical protein
MAANHTNCPFCSEEVSWPGYNSHILSVKHIEQYIKPALLKCKDSLKVWANATIKSACPMIYVGKNDRGMFICFGCKKACKFLPSDHLQNCPGAEKHLTTLKSLLGPSPPLNLEEEVIRLTKALRNEKKTFEQLADQKEDIETFVEKLTGKRFDDMTEEEQEEVIEGYKGVLLA